MKKIILLSLGITISISLIASPIDSDQAAKIAKNFYLLIAKRQDYSPISLSLQYVAKSKDIAVHNRTKEETALLYLFRINETGGFIIVSADDNVTPVLGYSITGSQTDSIYPPAFQKLIEKYRKEIVDIILNDYQADKAIQDSWKQLESGQKMQCSEGNLSVNPLVTTAWSQSPYVNDLCPYDVSAGTANGYHCVTGCPATAMAQIMKYWNYPSTGTGFHSYNHITYGTLSANFASTTYDWGAMPNYVTNANTAVATLMYHCGVGVEMNYGPNSSGSYVIISGSPTPEQCSEYAFKTYFGYNPTTIMGLERDNYSDAEWKNLLKADLNAGRPIQYAGFGQGGHTFVCDGYDNYNYFHMNWGWGGYYDGYFDLDALNPGTGGTGSGAGTYNLGQQALTGIQPASSGGASTIELYSSITISPNPIDFAQAFTVNADVINTGSNYFSGNYCAALFTSAGEFIDIIQILSAGNNPLPPGYHYVNGLDFSSSGLLTVPGTYIIGIFYQDPDGNWILAGNSSYANPVDVTINSPYDYIQLYSSISPTPTTFVQGQPASVNFNLLNENNATYFGSYSAVLYDLEGNFVQTIGTINETDGLPSGYIYTAPYLTVSTNSVNVPPGTYILAIEEKENGFSDWYLVGGQYFPNPININVVAPAINADVYESNDNVLTAYELSLSFSNGTATKNTTGSNIHTGTDLDYFKIELPSGYNYSIKVRIHDCYNSGNGQTYSGDMMFSYRYNSVWSDNYDDVMPSNIQVTNGGTIIFNVAPYFAGGTGTYLLDMSITRSIGIEEMDCRTNSITLYPNPAKGYVKLGFSDYLIIGNIQVIDNTGRELNNYVLSGFLGNEYTLCLDDYSAGFYFICIVSDKGILNKRLVIQK